MTLYLIYLYFFLFLPKIFSLSLFFLSDYMHFSQQKLNNYTTIPSTLYAVLITSTTRKKTKINDNDAGAESFAELFYHGCAVSLIKYQIYTTESLVLLMGFLFSILSKLLNSLSSNECLSIR